MTDFSAFTKLMPGFDLMQGLARNANTAMPGLGQWVAPTLDPAELDKRIGELRTVQFWLEQNVRMVDATIRGLEVQRMTLSTLQSMNVRTDELRKALQIPVPAPLSPAAGPAAGSASGGGAGDAAPSSAVDPLQWWGALTTQFATLAANALKDSTPGAGAGAGGVGEGAARKSAARKSTGTAKDGGRSGG